MSVYQPCDIRGEVDELSPELYAKWGLLLARNATATRPATGGRPQFVIGGDVRTHTPEFLAALAAGLAAGGAEVHSLGIVPTPLIYFAKRHLDLDACAIVTASHNPPRYNGLKWMIGQLPPTENDVLELRSDTERLTDRPLAPAGFKATELNIWPEYLQWLRQQWGSGPLAQHPLRVVLDPGHGCWARHALACIHRLFPGVQASAIFDTPDGTFPGRDPDCARPRELGALCAEVRAQRADLGIAFDGDGDRVAFVDDQGAALSAEQATWVLLHSMAGELPGRVFVYDLKFSDLLKRTAAAMGATPRAERSGHAFIRATMLGSDAAFGAEISGHYFYGALRSLDDGLYSALRMMSHLAGGERSLSQWRSACPPVYMTADLRLRVAPERRGQIIERARQAFASLPQTHIDGTRIDFADGWALVRASVTEPSLTFRFEGRDPVALSRVVDQFCEALGDIGQRVRHLVQQSARGS